MHPEYPGVLFEADERSLRDEAERARLDPIAQHIAQYVCENPDNLTIRDWAERTAGKELRDELKAIFGDSVTCKCVGAAFEQAVRLNLVTFDEVRTGPGRPKRVPRQRRTSDDGASAT